MYWQVRVLARNDETYEKLNHEFKSPELNFVFDEHGSCYMRSVNFDDYIRESDVEDVLSLAGEYIKVLNGILIINMNFEMDVLSTQEAIISMDDGRKIAFMFDSDTYDLRGRANIRTELNHNENPLNNPSKWGSLALKDKKVQQALSIIRFGLNEAVVMYKVFEIIRDDLQLTYGKKKRQLFMNIDDGFTDNKISSFTGSVNDSRILGENARHALDRTNEGEMSAPMSLEECKGFIYNVLYKWLHYKLKAVSE